MAVAHTQNQPPAPSQDTSDGTSDEAGQFVVSIKPQIRENM